MFPFVCNKDKLLQFTDKLSEYISNTAVVGRLKKNQKTSWSRAGISSCTDWLARQTHLVPTSLLYMIRNRQSSLLAPNGQTEPTAVLITKHINCSFEAVFLRGCLDVRSSSCEVIFL